MSVGHVAKAIEASGIPTVSVMVKSFAYAAASAGVPRTLVTQHPMGRPLGAANDVERHRAVIAAALDMLGTATGPGTMIEFPEPYRPTPRTTESAGER